MKSTLFFPLGTPHGAGPKRHHGARGPYSAPFFPVTTALENAEDANDEHDCSYDKDSWRTPLYLFRAARMRWDIEADAAATLGNSLCRIFFEDGLNTDWHRRARWVWCNPPYSEIERWVAKAMLESYMGCGSVLLIPTHNGTQWWSQYVVGKASHVLLITGRILFVHPTKDVTMKPAPFASCFVVYSPNPTRAPVQTVLEDFVLSEERTQYDEPALLRRVRKQTQADVPQSKRRRCVQSNEEC